jgi:hypothetical protein
MVNNKPIFLGNPQRGIKSPHLGIADIRNCDIHSEPGVLKINEKAQARSNTVRTSTFTANVNDEITTASSFTPSADNTGTAGAVTVSNSGGALPAGLAANTTYYLINISGSTVWKLAASIEDAEAGTAVNITDAGTGTHTVTSIEMGRPEEECTDPTTGFSFIVDHNGRVWFKYSDTTWRLLDGNTRTNGTGNGIAAAFGFLFVFRSTIIDVADVSTAAKIKDAIDDSIWTNGWKTDLTSATKHKTHIKDGIIYFGNARYMGYIEELTTFAPGTSSTYSYSATEYDHEQGWVVGPISELGNKVLAFASRGGQSRCFPWDPDQSSYDSDFPVPGTEVYDAKNILNTVFIAAGTQGCIYSTLGTVATLFLQIPRHLPVNGVTGQVRIRQIQHFRNRIYFAADSASGEEISGVWSVGLDGSGLNLEHQVSVGSYGTVALTVVVPLLHKPNDYSLHIGWQDSTNSVQGVDSVGEGNFALYTSYGAYIIFELLNVGSVKTPWTPGEILFQLTQALITSHGIRLSYRKDTSASFTTIGTYDFSTLASVLSHFDEPSILNAEMLQIKAELTGAAATTPRLRHITLS